MRKGIFQVMLISACVALSLNVLAAQSGNNSSDLGKVVVTATKTEVPLNETGSSISVITLGEIEKKGKKQIVDILQDIPGVTVSRGGAFGGQAGIFVRGGNSGNVLVLIDGVRINDPMNTTRGVNLAFLTADNVERIEVVKTPQSSLYGSDAQAVINIITKKGEGKPSATANFEAGSFGTFREGITLSGGNDLASYSLAVSRQDSDGISKAENKSKGSSSTKKNSDYEKDSFENTTIASKFNILLPLKSDYTFSVYYQSSKYGYDDNLEEDDPNKSGDYETVSFNNIFSQQLFNWWSHKIEYGRSTISRSDEDRADPVDTTEYNHTFFKSNANQAEWKHDFNIGDIDTISAGYNFYMEEGSSVYYDSAWSSNSFRESATTHSVFVHNHLKLMKRIFHTMGVRYDDHNEFGGNTTWNTTASVILPFTETRLKGSYGTSFKAPSLYQLYDSYSGNLILDPEKGKHYEAGFEQPLLSGKVEFGGTYFNNSYTDQIDYNFTTFKFENTGEYETSGYEGYMTFRLPMNLDVTGTYTYTDTENKATGADLLRRPKHKGSATLNWAFIEGANFNLVYNYVGSRYDYTTYPATAKLDDYSTVDIKLSYWMNENIQVYGRVENAGDKKYQEINGYAMPERAFYAGVEGIIQ